MDQKQWPRAVRSTRGAHHRTARTWRCWAGGRAGCGRLPRRRPWAGGRRARQAAAPAAPAAAPGPRRTGASGPPQSRWSPGSCICFSHREEHVICTQAQKCQPFAGVSFMTAEGRTSSGGTVQCGPACAAILHCNMHATHACSACCRRQEGLVYQTLGVESGGRQTHWKLWRTAGEKGPCERCGARASMGGGQLSVRSFGWLSFERAPLE